MQEFWATVSIHHTSLRFKMNGKSHTLNLENFRDMLQICPKLPGQKFEDPPFEEEILSSIRDRGHTRKIKVLTNVNVNYMNQPWRSFVVIINRCLSGKTTGLDSLRLSHSKAYKEYYVVASGEEPPKAKTKYKNKADEPITSFKSKTAPASKGSRIKSSAKVAKTAKKKEARKIFHMSHASGSGDVVDIQSKVPDEQLQKVTGINEGDVIRPEVPDVPKYALKSDEESWTFSQDEDDADEETDVNDDSEATESDNDGDDLTHPNLSTYKANDEEEEKEKADDDEVSSDHRVYTPSDHQLTDEEENQEGDDEVKEGEKEQEEEEELYGDLNINLHRSDAEITYTQKVNVQTNQVKEDTHTRTFVIVPIFVVAETAHSDTTIPQPPIPIIQPLQQTPKSTTTTTTITTTTLLDIPNFASLFQFDQWVSTLETKFSEFRQTNQFFEAISLISSIVDNYLASKVKEVVDVAVQLQTNKLKEEAQAENQDFLNQISQSTSDVLRNSSFTLRIRIKEHLIDKIEENQSVNISDIQKNIYNALVGSYNSNKDNFSSYSDVVTLKKGRDDQDKDEDPFTRYRGSKRKRLSKEAESSKEPTHKESMSTSSSKDESRSQPKSSGESTHAEEHGQKVNDLKDQSHQEFNIGNNDETSIQEALDVYESQWNPSSSLTPDRNVKVVYDKHAYWGTYHWGLKRQKFYGYASSMETSKGVYSRHRIIVVISLKIMKYIGYRHLEETIIQRQDDQLYKFREGDFKRLRRQDIEDMLLLLVQSKLSNLNLEERKLKDGGEGPSPIAPKSTMRNTVGKGKETSQENSNGPASDAAFREYCDKHYNQLLLIVAEKCIKKKEEETSKNDSNKNISAVRLEALNQGATDLNHQGRKVRKERQYLIVAETLKAVTKQPNREEQNLLLIKLITKENPHEEQKCCTKGKTVSEDTGSQDKKGRSQVSKRMICLNDGVKRCQSPSHIKTYDGSEDPEDHLKIFQAATKMERWAMPTWCHMFNSTLTKNERVWFDDLPQESIDSYDELKKAFLENYLQQKKYIKDPIKIYNNKKRDGESTEEFVRRYKLECRDVKGATKCIKISGFMLGITNPDKERIKKIKKLKNRALEVSWQLLIVNERSHFWRGNSKNLDKRITFRRRLLQPTKVGTKVGKERPREGSKNGETPRKDKPLAILMEDRTEGPMIIEAEMGGHFFHRMYVDGGSSLEIMYEYCFNRFCPEVRSQMVLAATPLVRFSGEITWPLRKISLIVRIGDEEHLTSAWMNFMVVRSPSLYNGIIGRPGVRRIQAGPGTHQFVIDQVIEEKIQVGIHLEYPEQTIAISSTLKEEGRKELCGLLRRNLDIFAWNPSGYDCSFASHSRAQVEYS
nr:reverse transcriptase domain-containing protein [Tanacetum cinerariifolium]